MTGPRECMSETLLMVSFSKQVFVIIKRRVHPQATTKKMSILCSCYSAWGPELLQLEERAKQHQTNQPNNQSLALGPRAP